MTVTTIGEVLIGRCFICVHGRTVLNMLFDVFQQGRCIRLPNDLCADFIGLAVLDTSNGGLPYGTTTTIQLLVLVLVPFQTTHVNLIGLYRPCEHSVVGSERFPNPVRHMPC